MTKTKNEYNDTDKMSTETAGYIPFKEAKKKKKGGGIFG